MKIQIYDIETKKTGEAYTMALPEGVDLGEIFRREPKLKPFEDNIVKVSINGIEIDDWRSVQPSHDDLIRFDILPTGPLYPILIALYYIVQIVSAIMSIVTAFTATAPKPKGGNQSSPTYSFEGIQDTFTPGEPIPAVYGRHRKGGEVLMYYLDMLPEKTGLAMSYLVSLGEGPIDAIELVELNDLDVTLLNSVTLQTMLGTSSQGVMPGFETIKNTFHDGREITDELANGVGKGRNQQSNSKYFTSIVYETVGNDVQQIEFFVGAMRGLTCIGKSLGKHHPQWSEYKIEYRDAGQGLNECNETVWTTFTTRRVSGKDQRVYWDNSILAFPYASRWDVKFTWLRAKCLGAYGTANWQLWLQEVTEFRGPAPAIQNEALVGIHATPTHQLNGGRPQLTAQVRGLKPDVYTSPTSFTTKWTQNPAWHVADYMTNSRYGMGAYKSKEDLNLQSFIDFATLADSMISTCEQLTANTISGIGNCQGTPDFHSGDVPAGDGGFHTSIFVDPDECVGLWSKKDGQQQYGVCIDRICCPPLDECWGVFSGEATCEWQERWATVTHIDTGSPIFGFVGYVPTSWSVDTFNGYGEIFNCLSHTVSVVRWNNAPLSIPSTTLLSVPFSLNPASQYFIDLTIQPAYTDWPNSKDWYFDDDTEIDIFVQIPTSPFFTTIINTQYIDTSALRFTKGGCGGLAEQGLGGVIVLPHSASGDFHGVHIEDYGHECGLCYGPCGQAAGGCLCNVDSDSGGSSSGTIIRHWDTTCQPRIRFNESTKWGIITASM